MEMYRYGMASQREIGEQLGRDELFGPPWRSPPDSLTLGRDEVHVWRASMNCTAAQVEILKHTLSGEELRRAGRYRFQKDREHFIVVRGLLRTILGCYLNTEPRQLRFRYGPHGKPALEMEPGEDTLSFNLSHSNALALFAVSRGRELGIDLEYVLASISNTSRLIWQMTKSPSDSSLREKSSCSVVYQRMFSEKPFSSFGLARKPS
jgi:hypothetical protein